MPTGRNSAAATGARGAAGDAAQTPRYSFPLQTGAEEGGAEPLPAATYCARSVA